MKGKCPIRFGAGWSGAAIFRLPLEDSNSRGAAQPRVHDLPRNPQAPRHPMAVGRRVRMLEPPDIHGRCGQESSPIGRARANRSANVETRPASRGVATDKAQGPRRFRPMLDMDRCRRHEGACLGAIVAFFVSARGRTSLPFGNRSPVVSGWRETIRRGASVPAFLVFSSMGDTHEDSQQV